MSLTGRYLSGTYPMIYDLMVPAVLKENARNLKKLFRGLGRKRDTHYRAWYRPYQGVCNGLHSWGKATLTSDWWEVTCLVCIASHRRIQCKT